MNLNSFFIIVISKKNFSNDYFEILNFGPLSQNFLGKSNILIDNSIVRGNDYWFDLIKI